MGDVVNSVTLEILQSVNSPDYLAPWTPCTRAQSTAWLAIPLIYRKWVVDHIEEQSVGEKAATDAALLANSRDAVASILDVLEAFERAQLAVILDEFNAHALTINAILDAIDAGNTLAQVKTNVAAIADYPQRTAAQLKAALRGKLGS